MVIKHNHFVCNIPHPNCPRCNLNEAAPNLLEACKKVNDWLQQNTLATNRPALLDKLLIDAITKAKG